MLENIDGKRPETQNVEQTLSFSAATFPEGKKELPSSRERQHYTNFLGI